MNRDEIREYIPHRGLNLLIDRYEDTGDGGGEGRIMVAGGDPLGRDLFLIRGPDGPRYLSLFLVEHAALACVLAIRDEMRGGRFAYFSTISRFVLHAEATAGTPIRSRVRRGRDRRDFRNFSVRVFAEDGPTLFDVGIMACLAPRSGETPSAPVGDAPPGDRPADPAAFPCLAPSLVFVGHREDETVGGIYPAGHPHVPGHFPGTPVMMGMAQWMAVAQAAALAAPTGDSETAGAGSLRLADGRPVVEVVGLVVAVRKDASGRIDDLRLLETKRVAFRRTVVPGDAYSVSFEPS